MEPSFDTLADKILLNLEGLEPDQQKLWLEGKLRLLYESAYSEGWDEAVRNRDE